MDGVPSPAPFIFKVELHPQPFPSPQVVVQAGELTRRQGRRPYGQPFKARFS